MSRIPDPAPLSEGIRTLSEFAHWLGDVSADRILLRPPPGMAGANDVLKLARQENKLCELVCGTLIEKRLGYKEMTVAAALMAAIEEQSDEKKLGAVTGPEGAYRLGDYLVRMPAVGFCAAGTYRGDGTPGEAAAGIIPQLVAEIDDGTSPGELERRLADYFGAGVKQVWVIHLDRRAATVYTSATKSTAVSARGAIDGGRLLKGLKIPVASFFDQRSMKRK